jgi:hypothetical protein
MWILQGQIHLQARVHHPSSREPSSDPTQIFTLIPGPFGNVWLHLVLLSGVCVLSTVASVYLEFTQKTQQADPIQTLSFSSKKEEKAWLPMLYPSPSPASGTWLPCWPITHFLCITGSAPGRCHQADLGCKNQTLQLPIHAYYWIVEVPRKHAQFRACHGVNRGAESHILGRAQ